MNCQHDPLVQDCTLLFTGVMSGTQINCTACRDFVVYREARQPAAPVLEPEEQAAIAHTGPDELVLCEPRTLPGWVCAFENVHALGDACKCTPK